MVFARCVALRKESVDRNINAMQIEIIVVVALRKESVDRNPCLAWQYTERRPSLSARRAWIEISMRRDFKRLGLVALRKESVDRNPIGPPFVTLFNGRSPQGERG